MNLKSPAVPAPQDKCGVKIDYVARRLGPALAPLGFKRKGRQLVAGSGEGDGSCWKIVSLQGDPWNEGSRGAFYVNLAIQFPALTRLVAQRSGLQWLQQQVDKVDETLGQFRERMGQLQAALPAGHACARPAHSDEYKFRQDSDMAALADGVVRAMLQVGLPWLEQHASLRALADFEGSLLGADVDACVAAAVLLGDRQRAQQILVQRRARFEQAGADYLRDMRQWFGTLGLDVSVLPAQPAAPRASIWDQQRQATAQAEEAAHAQQARSLRKAAGTAPLTPAALAQAWVAEHRARWRQEPRPLLDLPAGNEIAQKDDTTREAVLIALLQQLVEAEARVGARERFAGPADHFELDEAVRLLLLALLPTLKSVSLTTALRVLEQMSSLVTRWRQELVTGGYPWGFAALVQWLTGPANTPHRAALRPGIAQWLDAYREFALASHDQTTADLQAERSKALDPTHPLHEVLMEAREREAEALARHPPPSAEELRHRIGSYPEQQMAAADKQAVAALRRELRRDVATGLLPVAWDGDDWGQAAQQAWQAAAAPLRDGLTPTLQAWMEGVEARPTQRWLRTLDSHMAALPPTLAAAWRAWLLQTLSMFQTSSGHTEWATTGARPGVGARLGEASENLLLGLLWWAWRDEAIEAAALQPALQAVATGSWQRLPEVGARAPVVGGLALRMLAGLGDAARQTLAARVQVRGVPRQFKQAVESALKEALVR